MTTGTRTTDLRTVKTGACGTGLTGLYATKTWSGADQAPLPSAPSPTSYVKPLYSLEPFIDKLGRRRTRRVFTGETVTKTSFPKQVKRSKRYDEHAYSMSARRLIENPISWYDPGYPPDQQYKIGHPSLCFGSVFSVPASRWSSNDDLALINKLREKLLGDGDFDVGMFLVELPQAARMIANAAYRLNMAISFARKGNFREAERYLVSGYRSVLGRSRKLDAARSWLELQYGWKPLLHDAYHGAQQLAHMAGEPFSNVVRASRRLAEAPPSPDVGVKPKSGVYYTRHSYKAVIREVDVPLLTGLTNPETMAWEKLPYSFVVDWFIPIDTYLHARGVASSVSGTFVKSVKRYQLCKGLTATTAWMTQLNDGGFLDERVTFSRSISTSLSVPLPSFKPLRKAASWMHAANATALLLNLHGSANKNKWRDHGFSS